MRDLEPQADSRFDEWVSLGKRFMSNEPAIQAYGRESVLDAR